MDEELTKGLNAPMSMGELEYALKWFKKDKGPNPDGSSMEFYLEFLELLGHDLLGVIDEFQRMVGCTMHSMPPLFP